MTWPRGTSPSCAGSPEDWIWSDSAAHPWIVPAEDFTTAQTILHGRGGKPTSQTRRPTTRVYLFRGLLYCAACNRRMNTHWVNKAAYYRCRFPQEYALANKVTHPLNISIREDRIVPRLDQWLATAFDDDAVERTLDRLEEAQQLVTRESMVITAIRSEIAEADRKLACHRAALEAGADPVLVASWMKDVQANKREAQNRLERVTPAPQPKLDQDQLAAAIRELGDMVRLLGDASHECKARIYEKLGIQLTYHYEKGQVLIGQKPQPGIGQRFVSEGDSNRWPMSSAQMMSAGYPSDLRSYAA